MARAPRDHTLPIDQMIAAIAGIRATAAGLSAEQLDKDWMRMRAVERGFEILSEASRRIPDPLKVGEPDIPWRHIAGIGNILRHDYDSVSASILLTTMQEELPALEAALQRIRARL
jgi:uncharacterized protein with HEPN domain